MPRRLRSKFTWGFVAGVVAGEAIAAALIGAAVRRLVPKGWR